MKTFIMSVLALSLSLLVCPQMGQAQSWLWAKQGRNVNKQLNLTGESSVAMDNHHDAYMCGHYTGDTVIFGNDTLFGKYFETFLVKYDENGNVLWAQSSKSTSENNTNATAQHVVLDSKGNAYITGVYEDTISFQSFTLFAPINYTHAFLVKYDASGNVVWAKQSKTPFVGYSATAGTSIAVDKSDHIYLTGYYQSSVTFGNDTLKGSINPNVFLIKYDTNGNVIWAKQGLSTPSGLAEAYSVITNNLGNVYVTGFYTDSITFDSNLLINGTTYQDNMFLVKYDSNGNVIWVTQPDISNGNSNSYSYTLGGDNTGNIYVTGCFYDTISFGSYILINALSKYNSTSLFWAKYAPNGNVIWARQAYNLDTLQWTGWSITTDAKYNVYLTGSQGGVGTKNAKIIFGTDTLQDKVRDGSVWLKFDSSGNKVLNGYIFSGGGGNPTDPTVVDSSGCYVYFGATTLDTVMVFSNDTVGTYYDTFRPVMARWSDEECKDEGVNNITDQNPTITVFPNPATNLLTINLIGQIHGPATLLTRDITGREVQRSVFNTQCSTLVMDVSSLATGMYFVSINTNQVILTVKFIKI